MGAGLLLDLLVDPYCFWWKDGVPRILSGLTLTTAMFLVFKSPCAKFNWCIARSCARTWIPTVGITSMGSASFRSSSKLPWKRCSTKKRCVSGWSPAKSPMKSGKVSNPCSAFKTIASCSSSYLSLSFATKSRRPVMVSLTSKTWLLCPFPSAWPKTKRPASAGRMSWGWTCATLPEQHSYSQQSQTLGQIMATTETKEHIETQPLHQIRRQSKEPRAEGRHPGSPPGPELEKHIAQVRVPLVCDRCLRMPMSASRDVMPQIWWNTVNFDEWRPGLQKSKVHDYLT